MNENRLILPMAPATQSDDWANSLGQIAREASAAFACDEARHLRALYALLNSGRHGCILAGLTLGEPELIECLIMVGACDSAALALLAGDCGYMISRGSLDEHMATVMLSGQDEEYIGSGDSLALALVSAIALALGASANSAARPDPGIRQSDLRLN